MRLLLDESMPGKLKTRLAPHKVRTVPEMGWAGKSNGELLLLAEKELEVFLTADQSLSYQQNLPRFRIAVLVFLSNRLRDADPLVPKVLEILPELQPGTATVLRQDSSAAG
jgi:hypothetical protein